MLNGCDHDSAGHGVWSRQDKLNSVGGQGRESIVH
jgi:hypothetical protein